MVSAEWSQPCGQNYFQDSSSRVSWSYPPAVQSCPGQAISRHHKLQTGYTQTMDRLCLEGLSDISLLAIFENEHIQTDQLYLHKFNSKKSATFHFLNHRDLKPVCKFTLWFFALIAQFLRAKERFPLLKWASRVMKSDLLFCFEHKKG